MSELKRNTPARPDSPSDAVSMRTSTMLRALLIPLASLGIVLGTSGCASTSAPATGGTTVSPFDLAVNSYGASRAGIVTASLYDLKTGRTWFLHPRAAPQATASIVKVDILEALLYQAAQSDKGLSDSE